MIDRTIERTRERTIELKKDNRAMDDVYMFVSERDAPFYSE